MKKLKKSTDAQPHLLLKCTGAPHANASLTGLTSVKKCKTYKCFFFCFFLNVRRNTVDILLKREFKLLVEYIFQSDDVIYFKKPAS